MVLNTILITAEEVSTRLSVSPQAIYKWAKKGTLPSVQVGERALRFDPAEIQQFIDRSRKGGVR